MTEEYPEFIVKLNLTFKAIRVLDNRLIPTTWKIHTEVIYDEEAQESVDFDVEVKTTIGKINYWLDNLVSGSLIFSRDNDWPYMSFFDEDGRCTAGNVVTITPEDPTDDHLAEIIHSKFNAFGGDHIQFGIVELESDDTTGLSFMFTGDGQMNLPFMEEWVGPHAYFDRPWWARDDGSTYDVIPPEDADLSIRPESSIDLDFIRARFRKQMGISGNIVRPTFKPEVIKGESK